MHAADTQHTFTPTETDWGFTQFLSIDDVYNPKNGWISADDKLVMRVEIDVQKDERYAYDSRKETGYVGLKNQGATCYMNSLLQYIYQLPLFRKVLELSICSVLFGWLAKVATHSTRASSASSNLMHGFHVQAVYHMPTGETDEPSKSLPLALQSLFYKVKVSIEHRRVESLPSPLQGHLM